jgi:hypothetical protein
MEVIDVAFDHGFWVFGGYVRDVIIRGESKYTDIDIGCSWDQMHLIPKFIEEIGGQVHYDTLEATGRTQHRTIPFIRRILKIKTPFDDVDVIVFSSFEGFINREMLACVITPNYFYQTRDGLFMRGNFSKEEMEYYIKLTLQKKFSNFEKNCYNPAGVDKLLKKGWQIAS